MLGYDSVNQGEKVVEPTQNNFHRLWKTKCASYALNVHTVLSNVRSLV